MLDKGIIEPFRDTLFAGRYNLLLGAGVSLTSQNRFGHYLRSTDQLRADICKLTGASSATALTRAYGLLTPPQRQSELVEKHLQCRPSAELFPLSRCIWKRIFTFNIDDVVEELYAKGGQQRLISLNFDSAFEPDTDLAELQCVHLHGFARERDNGFVFSHLEYARALRGNNPWMLLLSEILPSEPFIIAGTSLNEVDLEFYLGRRTSSTPRKGRGPALLIEPNPDAATSADCERYNLTLVKAGIGEFLSWIELTFPSRPSVRQLTVPPIEHLFRNEISPRNLLRFFSDFELVSGRSKSKSQAPRPYMYGAEPTWLDIEEHLDVECSASQEIASWATDWFNQPTTSERLLIISEDPATGKSTSLKRVGHDSAALGRVVMSVRTLAQIDVDTAANCMEQLASPCIVLVDNIADYAEQIRELLSETESTAGVAFIGAERRYRQEYVDLVFADVPSTVKRLARPTEDELKQLIQKYAQAGLLADRAVADNPQRAVLALQRDTIAVAVCRILNDFRPLDRIVESLWEAANADQRKVFLTCALAHRCHGTGVRYSVLQAVAGMSFPVSSAVGSGSPLPLAANPVDDDFILPQSAVIADRVLGRAAKQDRDLMLEVFTALARALAPRVNRNAIMRRTPEARLAGRLFDGDKVVRPFLEAEAESFYVAVKNSWEWNSRYWEQRALLIVDRDIRTALQYAKHAVAIEEHPLPLTTLGKVLLKSLDSAKHAEQAGIFAEAFSTLNRAIILEAENARVTIHPFATLLAGTAKYLERGETLTLSQHDAVAQYLEEARYRFRGEAGLATTIERLDRLL